MHLHLRSHILIIGFQLEKCQQHANFPEGRPFYPDGVANEEEASDESEESGEEEDMSVDTW